VAFVFSFVTLHNGIFWAGSAPALRKIGGANRSLVHRMLGEDIPTPPPLRPRSYVRVRTPDAGRLAALAKAEGAKVKLHGNRVRIGDLPGTRIAELAADEHIVIHAMNPDRVLGWYRGAIRDTQAWKIRGYFLMKPVIASFHLVVAAGFWLAGLFYLTYPAWQAFAGAGPGLGSGHPVPLAASFLFVPLGAALLLASPWLTRGVCELDLLLIRGFLGPSSDPAALTERVKSLEAARAHVVDDSAARLRSIERDLHDGAQAQLVALAMKLGLAKEKLVDTAPADLSRVAQLVDDAHRNAIEAIAELRTLAKGIHPSVLDNGLPDALTTLAARSAVPVELVVDIQERPSAAIETIAYFSAAELLANVAKHSGARRATLEAVHVPGLLRIRVTDDGHGGASAVPGGGLRGLAERIRTVDGSIDIDSPSGGPTVATVELPSHA
ncbi:MAG TPA: sensor domain-containing protein, partial [Trebonia sp.]|nr:sensor domain-containing protein [Trebonia sp.]